MSFLPCNMGPAVFGLFWHLHQTWLSLSGPVSVPCVVCSVWYELAYIETRQGVDRSNKVWQLAFGSGFKFNSSVMIAKRAGEQKLPRRWLWWQRCAASDLFVQAQDLQHCHSEWLDQKIHASCWQFTLHGGDGCAVWQQHGSIPA